jgi:general secretion pathway protein C
MQFALSPRARQLLRRLPVGSPTAIVRAALIVALAVQGARLVWAVVEPLGPVGDWRGSAVVPPADTALLGRFDPFGRLGASDGPVAASSLPIKLFGVRLDAATGQSSAIIAGPDGVQQSFAPGDTVMPGVTLRSVAFDSVTIDRGGALEQVFLDQSVPPRAVVGDVSAVPPPPGAPGPMAASPIPGVSLSAPTANGVTVSGDANNPAFKASGLQPGDVVTAVNGSPVRQGTQIDRLLALPSESGITALTVTRGGQTLTVNVQSPIQ